MKNNTQAVAEAMGENEPPPASSLVSPAAKLRLPSTRDLRAFEATARLGSVRAAAAQLHLTPSAVSRRIQSLEDELGQPLFVRDSQGLILTEAGRIYAEQLRSVFDLLGRATANIRSPRKRKLKVLAPSRVSGGIMMYVEALESELPDIDLDLKVFSGSVVGMEAEAAEADIVFSWGEAPLEGWDSIPISPRSHIVLLCSRSLIPPGKPWIDLEDIPRHPWIVVPAFKLGWQRWYEALGLPLPTPSRIMTVSDGAMAMEAAKNGGGIVLGHGDGGFPCIPIILRMLVPAQPFHAFTDFGYFMNVRPGIESIAISRFRDWFFKRVWTPASMERLYARYAPTPVKFIGAER